jgi:hypothetical protein
MNEAGEIMMQDKMTQSQKQTKNLLALGLRGLPGNSGLDEKVVTNSVAW